MGRVEYTEAIVDGGANTESANERGGGSAAPKAAKQIPQEVQRFKTVLEKKKGQQHASRSKWGKVMNAVSCSEWQPLKSVGFFEFSSPVCSYLTRVNLKRDESLDAPGSGWQAYALLDPEMRIYEDSNGIVSIACYDALYYRGSNLIGATVDEAIEIIGRQPSRVGEPLWVSEDEQQRTIEFDELGLMLWFGAERIVISADCSN